MNGKVCERTNRSSVGDDRWVFSGVTYVTRSNESWGSGRRSIKVPLTPLRRFSARRLCRVFYEISVLQKRHGRRLPGGVFWPRGARIIRAWVGSLGELLRGSRTWNDQRHKPRLRKTLTWGRGFWKDQKMKISDVILGRINRTMWGSHKLI